MIRLLLWSFAVVVTIRLKLLWGSQSWLQPRFRLLRRRTTRYTAGEIAWAVTVASAYVPGAACLVQALAAEWMLAQAGYPSRLHIGVAKAGPKLEAHAWLESGSQALLGGAGAHRYTQLYSRDGPRG